MQAAAPTNLIVRDDTLLGICQALGDDFGFNPLFLRVALAAGLLWNPLAMVAIYLGAGAIVLVSRLLAPDSRRPAAAEPAEAAEAAAAPEAGPAADQDREPLPIAA
jgi:phage shock protein PspC (stress-responsive transcriptional regulator)